MSLFKESLNCNEHKEKISLCSVQGHTRKP